MKNDNRDELILFGLGFFPVIWLGLKIAPFADIGLWNAQLDIGKIFDSPFSISWCDDTFRIIGIFIIIYVCVFGIYLANRKNYRRQEEYGSAKWAIPKMIIENMLIRICCKIKFSVRMFALDLMERNTEEILIQQLQVEAVQEKRDLWKAEYHAMQYQFCGS